jgi:hypothetical protein
MGKICAGLALASLLMALIYRPAAPILGCVGASGLLLALVDALSQKLNDAQQTALADLVLLTPIVPLVVIAL